MDNTSNQIATAAIIARQWHHVAGRTKYDSPFNAYDLQNLLQVHTVLEGKKVDLGKLVLGSPLGCVFYADSESVLSAPIR